MPNKITEGNKEDQNRQNRVRYCKDLSKKEKEVLVEKILEKLESNVIKKEISKLSESEKRKYSETVIREYARELVNISIEENREEYIDFLKEECKKVAELQGIDEIEVKESFLSKLERLLDNPEVIEYPQVIDTLEKINEKEKENITKKFKQLGLKYNEELEEIFRKEVYKNMLFKMKEIFNSIIYDA